jgi:hypothetical protein
MMVTYSLTIDSLHTYYVVAGDTPVLVHNSNTAGSCGLGFPNDPYDPAAVDARSAANKELYKATNTDMATGLGYAKRFAPNGNFPFDSHGQEVFFNGKNYISPDIDGHNVIGWKMFNRSGDRIGTYDMDLNYVKP